MTHSNIKNKSKANEIRSHSESIFSIQSGYLKLQSFSGSDTQISTDETHHDFKRNIFTTENLTTDGQIRNPVKNTPQWTSLETKRPPQTSGNRSQRLGL